MTGAASQVEGLAAVRPTRRLRWARRLMLLGCVTLVLTAAAHLAGHLAGEPPPANDTEKKLMELVRTYKFEILGTKRTYGTLLEGYSVYYSASLLMLAVMGLPSIRWGYVVPKLIVAEASVLAAASLLFAVIAYFCWVPPPLVLHLVATVLFLGAVFCADVGSVPRSQLTSE